MSRNRVAALAAILIAACLGAPKAPALSGPELSLGARAATPPASLRAERLLDRDRLRAWGIERPSRLAFDDTGALHVLDRRTRRVVRIALGSASDETATTFGDEASASALPNDLALDRRGSLLVLDRATGTLLAYDARAAFLGDREIDGSLRDDARAPESRLVRDPYGNLWLLASRDRDLVPLDDRLIRRRDSRFLTPEESLVAPVAAAFLPRGGGWVADRGTGSIARFDATGHMTRRVALGDSIPGSPSDLATDDSGALFVADAAASRVVVFDSSGSRLHTRWLGSSDRPWRPDAIAWGAGDRVAVADESRDEIWIYAVERAAP